ncbi:MAG: hypothetical protein IMZ53_00475 [Thermoplasmata archaeon]|nr:hypothetical protein [Thermoplasmata archaeon]
MDDGYPTEEELNTLEYMESFNLTFEEIVDYIKDVWSDYGKLEFDGKTLILCTGGWSGNEDIISSLRQNSGFWAQYWRSSERGGKHTFDKDTL